VQYSPWIPPNKWQGGTNPIGIRPPFGRQAAQVSGETPNITSFQDILDMLLGRQFASPNSGWKPNLASTQFTLPSKGYIPYSQSTNTPASSPFLSDLIEYLQGSGQSFGTVRQQSSSLGRAINGAMTKR